MQTELGMVGPSKFHDIILSLTIMNRGTEPKNLKDTYDKIARDYFDDHAKDTWDNDYIDLFSK